MDQRSCQLQDQYYIYNNIYQRHLMLVANMALRSSADVLPCRTMFVFEAHFRFCRVEIYDPYICEKQRLMERLME